MPPLSVQDPKSIVKLAENISEAKRVKSFE